MPMKQMSERLSQARQNAGFKSARQAAIKNGWKISIYTAHENGQNDYGPEQAEEYGKTYKVSAQWLLFGTVSAEVPEIGIDAQIRELPPDLSRQVIQRVNAILEGIRIGRKIK